jgi:hypothetical protein
MGLPQKPKALYVANGWYLELPGLISPHFETFTGLGKRTGTVTIVDAGTNITYKFSSQIKDYGTIGLTRTMNGSSDDNAMDLLVNNSIENGTKYVGTLVKRHFSRIVFAIAFEGLAFTEYNWPDFNISSEDKLTMTYSATVDTWLKVP